MIQKMLNFKCHPILFGLYRWALGLYLLAYFALFSTRWIEFFGPNGISPIKLRHEFTLVRPSFLSYIHTEQGLWSVYVLIILATLAFVLGVFGKIPALFLFLTMVSIQNSDSNNVNAEEFSLTLFAFYALIFPLNCTWNFDWRTRKFLNRTEPIAAWTLFPFWLHIELIYLISLPLKPLLDPAWVDGSLLYYAVNNYDMSRIPGAYSIMKWNHFILSKIGTWLSLAVEGVFPLLVWTRRYRVLVILAMSMFQIGIAIFLSGVQGFSLSMLVGLVMFLPGQETYDFVTGPSWASLRNWIWPSGSELAPPEREFLNIGLS